VLNDSEAHHRNAMMLAGNPAMIGYVDKTAADKTVKVVFAP